MSRIAALGERRRIEGLSLAGVQLFAAEDAAAARSAWMRLGDDVAVVILTRSAERALGDLLTNSAERIWTTLPD